MSQSRKMVYGSFLVALNILATRLFSIMIPLGGIGALRLGFGAVPVILAGILLGPFWGGMVGLASDLLGFAINPMGSAFVPQITVIATLTGVIPGLILRHNTRPSFYEIFTTIGVTQIVLSIIVMPWVLYHAFGIPILVNLPLRILTQAILIPTYTAIVNALYRPLAVHLRLAPRHDG